MSCQRLSGLVRSFALYNAEINCEPMMQTPQCREEVLSGASVLATLARIQKRMLMTLLSVILCIAGTSYAQNTLTTAPANVPANGLGAPHCVSVTLAVALEPGQAANYQISGELCLPASGQADVVQVTVHGATYDHRYWNWPLQSLVYSYAGYMTRAGYAVFDYDRIGNGFSSHPDSTDVSVTSDSYVAHEVVGALRSGQLDGYTFKRVVMVGHSLGSYITIQEAATYRDIDALILTGIGHDVNPNALSLGVSDFYPAALDPEFSNLRLDAGYLTTLPNKRAALFYNTTTAEPAVIAYDESIKQTVTTPELAALEASGSESPYAYARQIQVPVLLVDGQTDLFFCQGDSTCSSAASLKTAENPFYSPAAKLQTFVVPVTGHDLNLHVTAPEWFGVALRWAVDTVGL